MKSSAVVLLGLAALAAGACGDKGASHNGHTYRIDATKRTWEEAQAAANGSGDHLVTITSADEQQFIASTFLTGNDQLTVFWIGCSDRQTEDTFVWVTGEAFSYTNWKSGEPNGWEGEEEDYCTINWNAVRGDPVGQWNDTPNVGSTGFDSGANDGPYAAIVESD